MKKGLTFCILLLVLASFTVKNNSNFNFLVKTKLENYSNTKWPEKIYVHTDKTYYTINDSLWFSAYLVNGITHLKSSKSKIVYIELINDEDSIVDQRKLFVNDISTQGDFQIKKDWKEGKYTLRAYTNYMRNSDPDYFFHKNINVWAPNDAVSKLPLEANKSAEQNLDSSKPDINFFPEGGYLVEKLTSKVAVKIKNNIISDKKISGFITDEDDTYITSCEIYDFGLGLFYLTPDPSKSYYFHIELNNSMYKYKLPKALPVGYNLTTTYKNNQLLIGLNASTKANLNGAYLLLHQRGKILYDKVLTTKLKNHSIALSTNDISEGVAHLTLFNPMGNPVCERLIFIENEKKQATIAIKNDKDVFGLKEKVSLSLNTRDFNEANITSDLSLSVRLSNGITDNENSDNIKTWLLLNSDLRGQIKNPSYFFSLPRDNKKQFLLDLVMMTNGWRRFTWQNLLYEKNKTDEFTPEKGIVISGTTKLLEKPYTLKPAYNSLTFLGDEISVQPLQQSTSNGKFAFGPFIFFDSIPAIIQSSLGDINSRKEKDRGLLISIDSPAISPKLIKRTKHKSLVNTEEDNDNYSKIKAFRRSYNFQNYDNSQKLNEVTVIGKKKKQKTAREIQMDDRSRFGFPSYRLDVQTQASLKYQNVEHIIAQFPGITFTGKKFLFRGNRDNPRFIIDDIESSFEDVQNLSAGQVSFIDFYRDDRANIYSNSKDGVIVIYTNLGRTSLSEDTNKKLGIINFYAQGFYTAREFYSPNYSKDALNKSRTDIRTTLYWNPKIKITEQDSLKNISFFTGDIKGDYIIEVEGITNTGIPVYQSKTFSIE